MRTYWPATRGLLSLCSESATTRIRGLAEGDGMVPESALRQLQQLLVTMAPVTLRVGLGATVAASFRTIGEVHASTFARVLTEAAKPQRFNAGRWFMCLGGGLALSEALVLT